ncbi:hypothetical protein MATL_G00072500 [Megalops atlanticus]|uniref:FBA domain-containing protein n=1 Tax=Megalops atlanticus TaxID=7932 RepID=A0A9D3Q4J6_MEGAT|nr:hypothetical protein MATL_G00072500 [Megalops atlanticus]
MPLCEREKKGAGLQSDFSLNQIKKACCAHHLLGVTGHSHSAPEKERERQRARQRQLHLFQSVEVPFSPAMARNLLKNPCGEEQMDCWELTENGGSEWRVEELPGDCGHAFCDEAVTKYFATSFELCLKKQVVDLLAEGYSADELDAQPAVTVEDWYSGRSDCGCTYQLSVALLDENQEVLQEFKPDNVTLDPDCDDCSWRQVTHTFSDYGPGLRFISFEHGGQDTKYWDGWFGVRVTGSSITIQA